MAGASRRGGRGRIKSPSTAEDDGDSLRRPASIRPGKGKDLTSIRVFKANLRILIGLCILGILGIYSVSRVVNIGFDGESQTPRVITPFPAPKLMDLPMFQGEHKESLYWGTYRPHVYFGVRARTPQSLVGGLMWIGVKDGMYVMRHFCENSDDLSSYGWREHNGRDFGRQELVEQDMILETSFLKSKRDSLGYGGDWAVRIDVKNNRSNDEAKKSAHLFFYLADEAGNALNLGQNTQNSQESYLLASGSRSDVGDWQIHLKSQNHMETHYSGFRTPHIHNLSDLVQQNLGVQAKKLGRLQLSDTTEEASNIYVFQFSAMLPFTIDIAFISGIGGESSSVEKRITSLTGSALSTELEEKHREFDAKFKERFDLSEKLDDKSLLVGKTAIGNMLGGIGYFYGQSKIAVPKSTQYKSPDNFLLYWPAELYTAVPSRPFFPRGFLWDEGFHQLLIWRWDWRITLDIIGHWLDLLNMDGWIPREQILGAEALSKVPEEFVLQHPSNGNPPTLFLVIRDLLDGIKTEKFNAGERDEILTFLDRASVRLDVWFQWFNTSQIGKEVGSYFWHGRDSMTIRELNPKTLSSGLDDYPRASLPSEDERHVDLRCWMLLAADCMNSITELLGKEEISSKDYSTTVKLLSDFNLLNQMHYDHEHGAYFDFGNHTEKVRLVWREEIRENGYLTRELVRETLETPKPRFVPHVGYVSLFPFMSRVIPPDSPILEKQLDLISNKSVLWTNYGLRSLAKTSSIYMKRNTEHDAPYWRGPIWMNMNYMILSSLHHYSRVNGPYSDKARAIYEELRGNLIRNVVGNYYKTGYIWEHYDQVKGTGKGARLFTGWSALILLIMSESYPIL
ncbi:PREDICTED: mannosyl-oligosaccharide glucosidase GCS1 [Tarenaya hassleriana]|uniref:mannosyl-oligosaccharide glucosidase GCS1 n=1 Tax=Tarenaya hassleriana TaxID=28532 RepID=UPI00053C5BB0|nr:PREDICTED: mannosyl-oligosaccharide glucosidase GCS1 [Tarenaya hassleriana]